MMISKKSFAAKLQLYRISRPPRLGNAVNIHTLLSQSFLTFINLKKKLIIEHSRQKNGLISEANFFKIPMAGPEKGVRCRYQQVCVLSRFN